jgi:hypothetical protein
MNQAFDPPPNWGTGSITQFLDRQRRNQYATFEIMRQPVSVLDSIGSAFEVAWV